MFLPQVIRIHPAHLSTLLVHSKACPPLAVMAHVLLRKIDGARSDILAGQSGRGGGVQLQHSTEAMVLPPVWVLAIGFVYSVTLPPTWRRHRRHPHHRLTSKLLCTHTKPKHTPVVSRRSPLKPPPGPSVSSSFHRDDHRQRASRGTRLR